MISYNYVDASQFKISAEFEKQIEISVVLIWSIATLKSRSFG